MCCAFLLDPLSGHSKEPRLKGSVGQKKGEKSQENTNRIYVTGPKNQHKTPSLPLFMKTG